MKNTSGSSTFRHMIWSALCLWLLALSADATAKTAPLPNRASGKTVGTVNCASSTCHGSIPPLDGAHVLQNEYTTWLRMDAHTQAYAVLLNERSQRIARKLGLAEGAHRAALCLDCHSHRPAGPVGPRHVSTEGVGCEGCHGPAGNWIASHTVEGVTHAENVAHGLYPGARPEAQARLCLSCHFGDDSRFVSHRLMGAGHPRLSFEIKTFSVLEPAHFRVDQDYVQRKGRYDSARLWAVGQAIAARHQLDTLVDPRRGKQGPFPELVLFDCHACHHPMRDERWTPHYGLSPGLIRLNDGNLLMLRALVRTVLPAESGNFDTAVAAVHRAVSEGEAPPGKDYLDLARELSFRIGHLIPAFEQVNYDGATQRRILTALIDEARTSSFSDYAAAEQACMAITNLINNLLQRGVLGGRDRLAAGLDTLLDALEDDERYSPADFQRRLEALKHLVVPG